MFFSVFLKMSERKKSELVSLANFFLNGQFINVITHMKEVIRLECPLNYFERRLICNSFYKLKYKNRFNLRFTIIFYFKLLIFL